MGPCMCGDICCPSCGPAQGNFRCLVCGAYTSDGGCENEQACAEEQERRDAAEQEQDFSDYEAYPDPPNPYEED